MFPGEKDLKAVRKRLEKAEPSWLLPEGASPEDRQKYKLCERFVIYLNEKKISPAVLARRLDVDATRMGEILKYRIDLFTVEKLVDLTESLELRV